MPMIDVYATTGTFADKHALAQDLAAAVMRCEQVPDLALVRNNKELTKIIAAAARDPGLVERTWVLLTEPREGGWGVAGHANVAADLGEAARAEMAAAAQQQGAGA
jgi:phenylpyruvate tautomerase PptA (4-oxalocrotonate tautomerase family)